MLRKEKSIYQNSTRVRGSGEKRKKMSKGKVREHGQFLLEMSFKVQMSLAGEKCPNESSLQVFESYYRLDCDLE